MGMENVHDRLTYYPVCNILGLNVSAVNMQTALEFIIKNIHALSGSYICVSNVHTTVMSYENPEYRVIQNSASMVLPDGGPLSSIGRRVGYCQMRRVTGPDLMGEIFKQSAEKGYRHYFFGSTEETLEKLKKELEILYHGLIIAGMYSPPFSNISDVEEQAIVEQINIAEADFVWIGLGAPKQEQWMYRHRNQLHGVMIGVGAGFDYHAGNIKRAPTWMQKYNLEWLSRLIQDPKRLLKRYLYSNIKFLWLIFRAGKL